MPLHEGLAEYALIAAFNDSRFKKIQRSELESLECGCVPSHPHSLSFSTDKVPCCERTQSRLFVGYYSTMTSSISLLTDFEDAESYLDWTIGVHGIYITFPHPSLLSHTSSEAPSPAPGTSPSITSKHTFSATYLPDVMPAQGWDKIEAVDSAIQKAGWRGRITEDLRRSVKLRRYQSRKCTVGWDEYIRWRKEHESAS